MMDNKEAPNSTAKLTESFVKKYWVPVYNHSMRLLATPSLAQELSALCLARVLDEQNASEKQSVSMKELYRISTELCLAKISGDRRRNTDWLRILESQKENALKNAPADEQRRQNLLDLLEMSRPESKPFVLYRFIEELDLESTAILCNLSRDEAKEKQEKFLTLANRFLKARGLDPIVAPRQNDCPDAYVMDRLMSGEDSGLDEIKIHVEQHEPCRKKLELMKSEAEDITEDLPKYMDEIRMAGTRLSDEKTIRVGADTKKNHFFLPALIASLATGALLWLLFPSISHYKEDPSEFLGYRLMLLQDENGKDKEIQPGQAIETGSELGIMLSSPKPMSVRILSLKEKGKPKSILPPSIFSWPVNSSTPQKLPFSYKIDREPGPERIFALFCPQEGMLKYLEQGLEFGYPKDANGQRHLDKDLQGAPPHCEMKSLLIRRTAPTIKNK